MKGIIVSIFGLLFVFAGGFWAEAQSMARSPVPTFSAEAKLDALAKKIDEQNVKIDLLSQQILKLQQQMGNSRPGVMVGEGAPSPSSPSVATTAVAPAASSPPAGGNSHIVARGETLTSIAKTHNVSVSELQKFNHIDNPLRLQAGQTIMIPPSPTPSASTSGD